jgi:hypothetical protein
MKIDVKQNESNKTWFINITSIIKYIAKKIN